jgi:hypothetical protein
MRTTYDAAVLRLVVGFGFNELTYAKLTAKYFFSSAVFLRGDRRRCFAHGTRPPAWE